MCCPNVKKKIDYYYKKRAHTCHQLFVGPVMLGEAVGCWIGSLGWALNTAGGKDSPFGPRANLLQARSKTKGLKL